MRGIYLLILVLFIVGCGAAARVNVPEGEKLIVVGTLSVERPTNESGFNLKDKEDPDFDVLAAIRKNLKSELLTRCFKVAMEGKGKYILKTSIVEYEPGSAFKRWLLPGWGATRLRTISKIIRANDEKMVAKIDFKGDVSGGGFYTVGAYKYIANWMAVELAKELRQTVGGPSNCAAGS